MNTGRRVCPVPSALVLSCIQRSAAEPCGFPLQGRRRAAEAARLERMIAQRRAAREAAWTAFRGPRIPLHQLLAAALGCAVPPLPDPSALPKRPPSASAISGSPPRVVFRLTLEASSYAAVM
jgi:hypothetical protein